MSKNNIIFFIGAVLFLMPFLGFPSLWENFFNIVFGVWLMGLSFSVAIKRRMATRKIRQNRKNISSTPSFVDAAFPKNNSSFGGEIPNKVDQLVNIDDNQERPSGLNSF